MLAFVPVFEAPLKVTRKSNFDPGALRGHVAVRNLSFRYIKDGPWTLDGVGFEARPGESVAIVGVSGSGKSTLLRLLLGFETPERGGVYYDDQDLETLDLRLVRRQVGTVLETAGLMPGTIFENVAGSAPMTRDQVVEAVQGRPAWTRTSPPCRWALILWSRRAAASSRRTAATRDDRSRAGQSTSPDLFRPGN